MVISPIEAVALKIVERYSHPGRTAYLYLFQLTPDSDFTALIPTPESVVAAWMDEGDHLISTPTEAVIDRSQITKARGPSLTQPQKLASHQRRQMMSRSILFSVTQVTDDEIEVHLVSRSLVFSPKGDREATEKWRRNGETWYSAY